MKPKTIKEFFVLLPIVFICGCASHVASTAATQTPQENAQSTPRPVYVGGEVNKGGPYSWTNGMTAADAIRQAGGFTIFAHSILVINRSDGTREVYRLKAGPQITNGIGTDWIIPNIPLRPGDQIYSPHE